MCQVGIQRLAAERNRTVGSGPRLLIKRPDDGGGSRPPAGLVKLGGIMSVSEDRTVQPSVQPAAPASGIADPAPLGLAAFALTTFLLSATNAGWTTHATGNAWLGYALAYGGVIQLLAGMWEFRNKNVFGSTAFANDKICSRATRRKITRAPLSVTIWRRKSISSPMMTETSA